MNSRIRRHAGRLELLECRVLLSLTFHHHEPRGGGPDAAAAAGGGPEIRLDLVALHEFGHSLGLGHDENAAVSIMDPYYNGSYDPATMFVPGRDPYLASSSVPSSTRCGPSTRTSPRAGGKPSSTRSPVTGRST